MSTEPTPTTVAALQADLAVRRERLAHTVDELTRRATPKALLERQTEIVKARLTDLVMTPEGNLRVERVAAAAAALVLVIGVKVALRRRHG